jgi:hypothetical protein
MHLYLECIVHRTKLDVVGKGVDPGGLPHTSFPDN